MNIKQFDQIIMKEQQGKEIMIPFTAAKSRYPTAVANILDQLASSEATEAKDKAPDKFKWIIVYTQPVDPPTRKRAEYLRQLEDNTQVFLVARGFRWKGAVELKGDLPEQIKSRYDERARLVCQESDPSEVNGLDDGDDDEVNEILLMVQKLAVRHRASNGYTRIIETALRSIQESR
jgi:hypothetical protein